MEEGDFYWDEVFRYARKRADVQISRFRQRSETADDRQWEIYVSWLVEPQRFRRDLRASLETSVSEECGALRVALAGAEEALPPDWEEQLKRGHTLRGLALAAFIEEGDALGLRLLAARKDPAASRGNALGRFLTYLTSIEEATTVASSPKEGEVIAENEIQEVSHRPFTLEEVPKEELRRRLNRGEIAPRDEWIPSLAGEQRKKIDQMEFAARMEFAERLNKEAKISLEKGDKNNALTLFTQGVNLLDFVTSEDLGRAQEIQAELSKFRRNRGLMALALEHYREAIESCDHAIKEDESDGKAQFIIGRAQLMLGELEAATAAFKALAHNPYCSDAQRQVGVLEWHKAQKLLARDRRVVTKLVAQATREVDFSTGRTVETGFTFAESKNDRSRDSFGSSNPIPNDSWTYAIPAVSDGKTFVKLLEAMLRAYTEPTVAKHLDRLRFEAEYDEKRMTRKLRQYLPSVLSEIYSAHGIPGNEFAEKQQEFDKTVGYFHSGKCGDPEVRDKVRILVAACREALMGPIQD